MKTLDTQTVFGWLFGIEAFLSLPTHLWDVLHSDAGRFGLPGFRDSLLASFLVAAILIFAVASLTVLREKPSARGWAIGASALYIAIYFFQLSFPEKFVWWHGLIDLLLGVVGLMVFSRRPQQGISS